MINLEINIDKKYNKEIRCTANLSISDFIEIEKTKHLCKLIEHMF